MSLYWSSACNAPRQNEADLIPPPESATPNSQGGVCFELESGLPPLASLETFTPSLLRRSMIERYSECRTALKSSAMASPDATIIETIQQPKKFFRKDHCRS